MNTLINKWKELREFALFSTILNTALTARLASYFFQPNSFASAHVIIFNTLSTLTGLCFTTISARSAYKYSRKIYYARNLAKLNSTLASSSLGKHKYEFALDTLTELSRN